MHDPGFGSCANDPNISKHLQTKNPALCRKSQTPWDRISRGNHPTLITRPEGVGGFRFLCVDGVKGMSQGAKGGCKCLCQSWFGPWAVTEQGFQSAVLIGITKPRLLRYNIFEPIWLIYATLILRKAIEKPMARLSRQKSYWSDLCIADHKKIDGKTWGWILHFQVVAIINHHAGEFKH